MPRRLYHHPLVIVSLTLLLLAGCSPQEIATKAHEILAVEPSGTAPHIEREFKYSVADMDDKSLDDLAHLIQSILKRAVEEREIWHATKTVDNDYRIDESAETFFYFDIYFDTPDNINYRNDISYRLRERFKSAEKFEDHLKNPTKKKKLPYRIEFQAKTDRQEIDEGLSQSNEARFEFRAESEPFGPENPPPSAPWDLDEFIAYFQRGIYKEYVTWPARAIVDTYEKLGVRTDELYFSPSVVVLNERRRLHLNITTPWGSVPNPEQSFIVTLDATTSYDASKFLGFMKKKAKEGKKAKWPKKKAEFTEIEIEFERNVSDKLDKEIEVATGEVRDELIKAREAFIADQDVIMSYLTEKLALENITIIPMTDSKYIQARSLK